MAALFERHRARVYARGRLWKKDDCAVDGARATNRGWVLHRAELRGYALSLTPDTVVEKGTRATSYINVADAHVDWAGELADAGVFALSSAGRNRYLLQPCGDGDDDAQHPPPSSPLTPSNINARDDLLCNWVTALRLSAFEHALLGQVYTEALYNWRVELKRAEMDMLYPIVDRKGVRKAVKEVSVEGWLQARMLGEECSDDVLAINTMVTLAINTDALLHTLGIAGSLEWKQFYCVVRRRSIENDQPPTTQPSSRWSRGTKALKISQHTSQHTSSHVGTLMLFATRKDAEKAAAGKWKDTGKIATLLAYEMLDVEEAFAVFPEKVELVDLATM